jgi:succinyl-CoA synthetase beta subunit
MLKDSVSLLLPTTEDDVLRALNKLHCAPLLSGFRGRPAADVRAAAEVILAVAAMVEKDTGSIVELDINPLLLLPDGQGVVAADALIKLNVME